MKPLSDQEKTRRKRFGMSAIKHGQYKTPEYNAWLAMKQRCSNRNHPCFKHYGARGISVCDEWQTSFQAFFRAMGERPSPQHTLERRDNERGYSPGNCYWATRSEQLANTRRTNRITMDGKTQCLKAWCRELGQNYGLALRRIKKLGWNVRKALTEPAISKFSNKVGAV